MGLRFFCVAGEGGSQEWAVALLGVHTTSKNPPLFSGMQAYISYLPGSIFSEVNFALLGFSEVRVDGFLRSSPHFPMSNILPSQRDLLYEMIGISTD